MLVLASLAFTLSNHALAGDCPDGYVRVKFKNASSTDIFSLHASPTGTTTWGPDLLEMGGDDATFLLEAGETDSYCAQPGLWDFRADDAQESKLWVTFGVKVTANATIVLLKG